MIEYIASIVEDAAAADGLLRPGRPHRHGHDRAADRDRRRPAAAAVAPADQRRRGLGVLRPRDRPRRRGRRATPVLIRSDRRLELRGSCTSRSAPARRHCSTRRSAAHGDARGLRHGRVRGRTASCSTLVDRTATTLAGNGVSVGSRVGLSAGNSAEFVAAVFATARLGATIVMISTAWREREVATRSRSPRRRTGHRRLRRDRPRTSSSPIVRCSTSLSDDPTTPRTIVGDIGRVEPPIELDDLAVMVFSSGTTGLPEGRAPHPPHVVPRHRALGRRARADRAPTGCRSPRRRSTSSGCSTCSPWSPPARACGSTAGSTSTRCCTRSRPTASRSRWRWHRSPSPWRRIPTSNGSTCRRCATSCGAQRRSRRRSPRRSPAGPGCRVLAAYGASELPLIAVNPVDRPDEWRLDSVGLPPDGRGRCGSSISTPATCSSRAARRTPGCAARR